MRAEIVQQGSVAVIRLDGLFTFENLAGVESELTAQSQSRQPRILLDMTSVPLLDSAGMELLLDMRDNSESRGGAMKLVGLTPHCREILSLTGVLREFETFDNQISALGSFAT